MFVYLGLVSEIVSSCGNDMSVCMVAVAHITLRTLCKLSSQLPLLAQVMKLGVATLISVAYLGNVPDGCTSGLTPILVLG